MSVMRRTFCDPLSFVLHVTRHEGRSLERLLAPLQPGDDGPSLGGAIVQASYVAKDPALLVRFADGRIPWAVEPQSNRFATPGYLSIGDLAKLPYAPASPLDPTVFGDDHRRMVEEALRFQAKHEPAMYIVPSLPIARASMPVLRAFEDLHKHAWALNGTDGIPYRPMLATAYPGTSVVKGRFSVFDRLADRTWAGVYVQPLQLDAKRDSVEKLVAYTRFLQEGRDSKLQVIAGRPGGFGLILGALGIDRFDAGLGGGDSFSLTRLDRPTKRDDTGKRGGGRSKPVYIQALLSSLPASDAGSILDDPAIGSQVTCTIGECRHGGRRLAIEQPRVHFFHCRDEELRELRDRRAGRLRVQHVYDRLQNGISTARLINRVRADRSESPMDFEYLDRWVGVLARVATGAAARTP